MPYPKPKESEKEYIKRCLSDAEMKSKHKDFNERFAVCKAFYTEYEANKTSFDYDGVLTTSKGKELLKQALNNGEDVYVISARSSKENIKVDGVSKIYATGSNKAKIEKIKELGIKKHYDNNPDVIKELNNIGVLFKFAESYSDYPKQAIENAKIALRWAEKNGWGECGTAVGKARANQLANGEAISEDTIARMASFERHRQNSQKQLGDGCGRLMWLAWGGDEGIEWAQRKLKLIRDAR